MKKIIYTLLLFLLFIPSINASIINYKTELPIEPYNHLTNTTNGYITITNNTNTIINKYNLNNELIITKQIDLLTNITTTSINNNLVIAGLKPNGYITIIYLDENLRITNQIDTEINSSLTLTKINLYNTNNKLYLLLTTDDYLLLDNNLYCIDELNNITNSLFASIPKEELVSIIKSDYYLITNTYKTDSNISYYYKVSKYNKDYDVIAGYKEDINYNKTNIITIIYNDTYTELEIPDEIIDIEIINNKIILLTPYNLKIYGMDKSLESNITLNNQATNLNIISNNLIIETINSLIYYEYDIELNVINEPYGTITINENPVPYELVTLDVVSNSGYEVSNIEIIDDKGNLIPLVDNQFIMPNNNVNLIVSYQATVYNPDTVDAIYIMVISALLILFILIKAYKKLVWLK